MRKLFITLMILFDAEWGGGFGCLWIIALICLWSLRSPR